MIAMIIRKEMMTEVMTPTSPGHNNGTSRLDWHNVVDDSGPDSIKYRATVYANTMPPKYPNV